MGDIIRLRCSPHEQTQLLLPWYANGTLDPEEGALIKAHIAECADCRADLQREQVIGAQVADLPMDLEHGWTSMASRLDAPPPRLAPVAFLRRRVAVGWVVAGQFASTAALLLGVYVLLPHEPANQSYHALGSPPATESGNILVIFQSSASERDMRAALLRTNARLVDGPNTTGAYVLRVMPANRDDALKQLRQLPQIMLAEPVDAAS